MQEMEKKNMKVAAFLVQPTGSRGGSGAGSGSNGLSNRTVDTLLHRQNPYVTGGSNHATIDGNASTNTNASTNASGLDMPKERPTNTHNTHNSNGIRSNNNTNTNTNTNTIPYGGNIIPMIPPDTQETAFATQSLAQHTQHTHNPMRKFHSNTNTIANTIASTNNTNTNNYTYEKHILNGGVRTKEDLFKQCQVAVLPSYDLELSFQNYKQLLLQ